jgi:hypothetical protein
MFQRTEGGAQQRFHVLLTGSLKMACLHGDYNPCSHL